MITGPTPQMAKVAAEHAAMIRARAEVEGWSAVTEYARRHLGAEITHRGPMYRMRHYRITHACEAGFIEAIQGWCERAERISTPERTMS